MLRVPGSYSTLTRAVTASRPGDLILVAPGIYHESLTVPAAHPGIVIRGADRNRVILDGAGALADGIDVQANGVAVENLTVRHFAVNGLVFAPAGSSVTSGQHLQGWRGSYLTAYDNGLYGLYAYAAQHGQFDHDYASGHPDSGIYVGQCRPCDARVTDNTATVNAVGYEDTNASGGLLVRANTLRGNRIGALLDSALKESLPPQSRVELSDNQVLGNDNPRAPSGDQGFAAGIVISGGDENVIARNLISGHRGAGVVVIDASRDHGGFPATNNRISANRLRANGVDLALLTSHGTQGNCFTANHPNRTAPARVERRSPCLRSVPLSGARVAFPANPPQVAYATIPAPPPQPQMAAPLTARARPAAGPAAAP